MPRGIPLLLSAGTPTQSRLERVNSRALRLVGPVILVAAALLMLIVGLAYGGGADPLQLTDPGPVVRWGLPVAKVVVNLSAAVMVGALVLSRAVNDPLLSDELLKQTRVWIDEKRVTH